MSGSQDSRDRVVTAHPLFSSVVESNWNTRHCGKGAQIFTTIENLIEPASANAFPRGISSTKDEASLSVLRLVPRVKGGVRLRL